MRYRLMIEIEPDRPLTENEINSLVYMIRTNIEDPLVFSNKPDSATFMEDATWQVDHLLLEMQEINQQKIEVTRKKKLTSVSDL